MARVDTPDVGRVRISDNLATSWRAICSMCSKLSSSLRPDVQNPKSVFTGYQTWGDRATHTCRTRVFFWSFGQVLRPSFSRRWNMHACRHALFLLPPFSLQYNSYLALCLLPILGGTQMFLSSDFPLTCAVANSLFSRSASPFVLVLVSILVAPVCRPFAGVLHTNHTNLAKIEKLWRRLAAVVNEFPLKDLKLDEENNLCGGHLRADTPKLGSPGGTRIDRCIFELSWTATHSSRARRYDVHVLVKCIMRLACIVLFVCL